MRCDDLLDGKCSDINLQFDVFVFISGLSVLPRHQVSIDIMTSHSMLEHGWMGKREEETILERVEGLNEICELVQD
jgi:hypothetical protein